MLCSLVQTLSDLKDIVSLSFHTTMKNPFLLLLLRVLVTRLPAGQKSSPSSIAGPPPSLSLGPLLGALAGPLNLLEGRTKGRTDHVELHFHKFCCLL